MFHTRKRIIILEGSEIKVPEINANVISPFFFLTGTTLATQFKYLINVMM
jgi:hypothetical protein